MDAPLWIDHQGEQDADAPRGYVVIERDRDGRETARIVCPTFRGAFRWVIARRFASDWIDIVRVADQIELVHHGWLTAAGVEIWHLDPWGVA